LWAGCSIKPPYTKGTGPSIKNSIFNHGSGAIASAFPRPLPSSLEEIVGNITVSKTMRSREATPDSLLGGRPGKGSAAISFDRSGFSFDVEGARIEWWECPRALGSVDQLGSVIGDAASRITHFTTLPVPFDSLARRFSGTFACPSGPPATTTLSEPNLPDLPGHAAATEPCAPLAGIDGQQLRRY